MTNSTWLEAETARRYHMFAQQTTMYQELSRLMVQLAEIEPGMRVLDLGCGTGITTRAVLEVVGEGGHVYAVDISGPMLAVAREQAASARVTFIQADAVAITGLADNSVERVVCNSVFWQFRHKPQVMAELRRVLAPQGRFVFNAPEPYFMFEAIPRSRKVSVLFEQLAAERYGVGRQDLRSIEVFLRHCGFEIVGRQMLERTRSAAESYLFMQIPVATAWMEPPLEYETRLALLEEAHQLAELGQATRQRWMYFVVRPL
ncbi:MAG: methyltransferase domain-containing protein [Anaerolineae bacterium]|nr:methyltransferase domain-containing protein [Anaerolineae bacterium]